MANTTITITRGSKLGWEWTYWTTEHPEAPAKPYWVGTIRKVLEAIAADRNYQAEKSGGTYITEAWFVKTPQGWKRIIDGSQNFISQLTDNGMAEVEIE
jgi:hypothetical protein